MNQGKGGEETKSQKERHGHIPDFLLCRITDDFMQEPVIIQSGFTYEKKAIIQHFQINGCTDPITRQQVDPHVMIPNHYLKQASEYFIEKNPWSFMYIPGEDYM